MTFGRHHRPNPEDEQQHRIERWYRRLSRLPKRADETTVIDLALVLLQQCHAMRDWLLKAREIIAERDKKNPSRAIKSIERRPISKAQINNLFATQELQTCRAIVNGSKHLHLDDDDPRQKYPHIDPKIVSDVMTPPSIKQRLSGKPVDISPAFVLHEGTEHETRVKARDLCQDCVMRIRGFLLVHGRPTPQMMHDPDTRRSFAVERPEGTSWPPSTSPPTTATRAAEVQGRKRRR